MYLQEWSLTIGLMYTKDGHRRTGQHFLKNRYCKVWSFCKYTLQGVTKYIFNYWFSWYDNTWIRKHSPSIMIQKSYLKLKMERHQSHYKKVQTLFPWLSICMCPQAWVLKPWHPLLDESDIRKYTSSMWWCSDSNIHRGRNNGRSCTVEERLFRVFSAE